MTEASATPLEELEATENFLLGAYLAGVISRRVLRNLERYANSQYRSKVAASGMGVSSMMYVSVWESN